MPGDPRRRGARRSRRAVGEFGSVVLITRQHAVQDARSRRCSSSARSRPTTRSGAAAVSVVLLAISLVVLLGIAGSRRTVGAACRVSASRIGLRVVALGYLGAAARGPGRAWSSTARSSTASAPPGTRSRRPTRSARVLADDRDRRDRGAAQHDLRRRSPRWLLVRRRLPRQARCSNALIDLPFAVSPVVVGLALMLVYGRAGWFGMVRRPRHPGDLLGAGHGAGDDLRLAAVRGARGRCPCCARSAPSRSRPRATLGAIRWQTFWRITLPAIRWGVAYGVVLTTARALGEFGAVAVVSGKISGQTETLTLLVEDRFQHFDVDGRLRGVGRARAHRARDAARDDPASSPARKH